jgi:hypothetical protein
MSNDVHDVHENCSAFIPHATHGCSAQRIALVDTDEVIWMLWMVLESPLPPFSTDVYSDEIILATFIDKCIKLARNGAGHEDIRAVWRPEDKRVSDPSNSCRYRCQTRDRFCVAESKEQP